MADDSISINSEDCVPRHIALSTPTSNSLPHRILSKLLDIQ